MATFDCRMIGVYPTCTRADATFVDTMTAAEQPPGILSVSLGHGFPWGDAPAIGARMLVVSDGDLDRRAAGGRARAQFFFAAPRGHA